MFCQGKLPIKYHHRNKSDKDGCIKSKFLCSYSGNKTENTVNVLYKCIPIK